MNVEVRNQLEYAKSLSASELVEFLKGINDHQKEGAALKFSNSRELRAAFEEVAKDCIAGMLSVLEVVLPEPDTREAYFTKKNGTPCQSVTVDSQDHGPWTFSITAVKRQV